MSTREERLLAGRQVFAKVIASDVKAHADKVREMLEPLIDVDGAIAAELPDGTRIGSVKRSKTRKSPAVTDEAALLAWVKKNRPEEIVESVNPAFVEYLKAQVKKRGEAVYEATGEIVPGVEMVTGSASYLPQADQDMVPAVRAAFAQLIGRGFLALPAADETEGAA